MIGLGKDNKDDVPDAGKNKVKEKQTEEDDMDGNESKDDKDKERGQDSKTLTSSKDKAIETGDETEADTIGKAQNRIHETVKNRKTPTQKEVLPEAKPYNTESCGEF